MCARCGLAGAEHAARAACIEALEERIGEIIAGAGAERASIVKRFPELVECRPRVRGEVIRRLAAEGLSPGRIARIVRRDRTTVLYHLGRVGGKGPGAHAAAGVAGKA